MDFPIQVDTIRLELSILYSKGSQDSDVFLSLKIVCISVPELIVFILAKSADPHEMLL